MAQKNVLEEGYLSSQRHALVEFKPVSFIQAASVPELDLDQTSQTIRDLIARGGLGGVSGADVINAINESLSRSSEL